MIYFHTYKTDTQLSIDIVQDIRRLNDMSVKAKQAGMIILGGGVCKHQIANAMLFVSPPFLLPPHHLVLELSHHIRSRLTGQRNGADYSVYINTGQEVCLAIKNEADSSTMDPIPEQDLMKLSHGVRSAQEQKVSRSVRPV